MIHIESPLPPSGQHIVLETGNYQFLSNGQFRYFNSSNRTLSNWEDWKVVDGEVCKKLNGFAVTKVDPSCGTISVSGAKQDSWTPFPDEVQEAFQKHLNEIMMRLDVE